MHFQLGAYEEDNLVYVDMLVYDDEAIYSEVTFVENALNGVSSYNGTSSMRRQEFTYLSFDRTNNKILSKDPPSHSLYSQDKP